MQSSVLPLNFSTFYLCGIKPFTKISQRNCVNLLLKGVHPTSDNTFDVLSDSVCSNYIKGKKSIKDVLRIELLNLPMDTLKKRIDSVGIQDPMQTLSALQNLIKISTLQQKTKSTLLKSAENEDTLLFIAKVFIHAIRAIDVRPLSDKEQAILDSCTLSTAILTDETISSVEPDPDCNHTSHASTVSRTTTLHVPPTDDVDEETEWMMDYLLPSFANDPLEFAAMPIKIQYSPINMPMDYCALVYTLKPSLISNTLRTFKFHDFLNAMSIDEHSGKVCEGSLFNWIMQGSLESICAFIETTDFSLVSDFSCQLIGQFNLDESDNILSALRLASNNRVNILSSLIYVEDAPSLELRLIAHVCIQKSEIQKNFDADGVQIYNPKKR